MEQTLGVRLLDRTPHGVTATVYAEALLDRSAIIFDELRQAVRDIEYLADPTTGEVGIGCSVMLAQGFVGRVINDLILTHPGVRFRILAEESGAIYHAVEKRKVDFAVARLFTGSLEPHLATEILYHEPHVVAASLSSPLLRQPGLQLSDLMIERWVLPPLDTLTGEVVREAFEAAGLAVPKAAVVTASTPARCAFVSSGNFVSVLPSSVLSLAGFGQRLGALAVDLSTASRPIGLVTLRNRTISPVARLFIDRARAVARAAANGSSARSEKPVVSGPDEMRQVTAGS